MATKLVDVSDLLSIKIRCAMHPDKEVEIAAEDLDVLVTDRGGIPRCLISYECPACNHEHETVIE
jgi:hypothetical protein